MREYITGRKIPIFPFILLGLNEDTRRNPPFSPNKICTIRKLSRFLLKYPASTIHKLILAPSPNVTSENKRPNKSD